VLAKILKGIRDPKYGLTTRALSYVFTSEGYCPFVIKKRSGISSSADRYDEIASEWASKSMETAKRLVLKLKRLSDHDDNNNNNNNDDGGNDDIKTNLNVTTISSNFKNEEIAKDQFLSDLDPRMAEIFADMLRNNNKK
jgi:hypothetical protein